MAKLTLDEIKERALKLKSELEENKERLLQLEEEGVYAFSDTVKEITFQIEMCALEIEILAGQVNLIKREAHES